ncbi:unnamed protein product, partial [Ectocarpus sp. 13 AM-2016]
FGTVWNGFVVSLLYFAAAAPYSLAVLALGRTCPCWLLFLDRVFEYVAIGLDQSGIGWMMSRPKPLPQTYLLMRRMLGGPCQLSNENLKRPQPFVCCQPF